MRLPWPATTAHLAKAVEPSISQLKNWVKEQPQAAIPNSKLDSSENLTPRGLYNS